MGRPPEMVLPGAGCWVKNRPASRSSQLGAQLHIVAVGIFEVQGLGGNPLVSHRARHRNPTFSKRGRSRVDLRFRNGEGEMLPRTLRLVLLKHDHPIAGAQEHPPSPLITKTDVHPEHVPVESLGLVEVSNAYRNFVDAADRKHVLLLLSFTPSTFAKPSPLPSWGCARPPRRPGGGSSPRRRDTP